jgi:hypothetical protein
MIIQRIWLPILIFYVIALVFAFFFRIATPEWYNAIHLQYGLDTLKSWFSGLGPFLGAIVVIRLFKLPWRNTLWGSSRINSLLMATLPILLFTIIGAGQADGLQRHFVGFIMGLGILGYCLLEEMGWRGYLQAALHGINPILKYTIIGFLWYTWHLSFLEGELNMTQELTILVILIIVSSAIGQAIEHTRSIVVAACLHMVGNILAFSSLLRESVAGDERLLIVGICALVWAAMLIFWDGIASYFARR